MLMIEKEKRMRGDMKSFKHYSLGLMDERYNTASDKFVDLQTQMRKIGDLIIAIGQDEDIPDKERVKRKLKQIEKIWKDVERSLGPTYSSYDYPHKTKATHRQKKLGLQGFVKDWT